MNEAAIVRTFDTGATRDTDAGKPDYAGFLSPLSLQKVDDYTLRERELAWAGGIFEGEGCIQFHQKKPSLQVKMCDEDTLRRFALVVGLGKVYGPYQVKATANHKPKSPWRPYFSWQARGQDAIDIGRALYPYLGSRRRATLQEKWGVERLAEVCGMPALVVKRMGEYMLKHQVQSDGTLRASGNWKKGIPLSAYMESSWRHYLDVWLHHEGHPEAAREPLEDAICAVLFNLHGYLHELLSAND